MKYAPKEIKEENVVLLNDIVETGEFHNEIKLRQLTPLQKPGKPKGPAEHPRQVNLLSALRIILAIYLIKRISNRLHEKIVRVIQTAYTSNRAQQN